MNAHRRVPLWSLIVAGALCGAFGACRSAVKDFYDPLTRPTHCGGAAGAGGQGGSTATPAGGTGGGSGQCAKP